jgi:hypothetical protein
MLSLTSYCEIILGKSIDKSECKSVWTRRPLRPSQVRKVTYISDLMGYENVGIPFLDPQPMENLSLTPSGLELLDPYEGIMKSEAWAYN